MREFYAHAYDEERCIRSSIYRAPVTITGLTVNGRLEPFTGTVQSVERVQVTFAGYPLRITIEESI